MADTINMPKLGFDMAEGTLVRWLKKIGETVNKGDLLAEIETDKATVEVESSASGVVRLLLVDEGAVVPVNTPIAVVGSADEDITGQPTASETPHEDVMSTSVTKAPEPIPNLESPVHGAVKASPLARKLAFERGIDLTRVQGSGPGGRIVRRDLYATVTHQPSPAQAIPAGLDEQTVTLSKLRQVIARRMVESKTTIPHFTITHEYKVDSLLEIRRQMNNILADEEKISVNDFIIKAAAQALEQFPNLNATISGNELIRHGEVNIGVAVAVEGGLLTIVCKNANTKSLKRIASEVKGMAGRARDGKVRPEDIEGSTFSISNLGMFDVESFTAIINPPEAAILALGSAREVPVAEDGELTIGWRMKATLSADHRISDGAEAAKFMQALAGLLEEPAVLLM